jgi:hypothetical protein
LLRVAVDDSAYRGRTMEAFLPDFEIIKMDAEVSSYQEDFESEGDERREAQVTQVTQAKATESPNDNASA